MSLLKIGDFTADAGTPPTGFAASGCTPLGTVYAPAAITLTLTGSVGTLPCAALLEFSGDGTAFVCYEIEGQELLTPVEVGSLPLNVRYLSWEQGTAITLKFYPVFVDGTEKTCDIVIKDAEGTVLDTKTLSATYADPVRGVLESIGGLLAGYDMSTAADGIRRTADIAVADDVGSADVYGDNSDKYAIVPGAPANCGSANYISKMLECADGAAAKIGAASAASGCKSRWGIVELDFDSYSGSAWFLSGGTAGSPNLSCLVDVDTNAIVMKRDGGTTVLTGSPAPSGTKAYLFGFSYHSGVNKTYFWLCDFAGTWSARQTAEYSGDKVPDGICFGTGFGAPSPNGSKWVLGSQSTVEYSEVNFEALFDACKA